MENTTKLLDMASYIFMFCMAVTILVFYDRGLNNLISSAKNEINNQNIYYEKERYIDEFTESKVAYADLISTLLSDLDYDIQIDDMSILKENYNYQQFDFSTILQAEYTKSYQYDSSGNIVKVIYKS